MDSFTSSRIIDLICLPWSENDSTKFLVENFNKFKIIRVEELNRIGCTEQELSSKDGGWVSTKNSVDGVLKFIENIYSILGDNEMAKYVSENWDNFFMVKKNSIKKKLHKFFDDYPMKEQSRTMTVIKACDRDCVNITTHHLEQQFNTWGTLKHSQRHSVFIKGSKTTKEKIQIIHYVESSSKLFTLNWQLVIELDWNILNSKIKVNLLMNPIQWKKDSVEAETMEAVELIVNRFSDQQDVIESPLGVQKKLFETPPASSDNNQDLDGSETDDDDQLLYLEESKLVQGSITPENVYKTQAISLSVVVGDENEPLTTRNPSLLLSNTTRIPHELQGTNIIGNESTSIYSSPFLLPGESIQLVVPNINYHSSASSSSSSSSSTSHTSEKKASKSWFGLGSEKSKANSTTINGCLILTNFQIIFVPVPLFSPSPSPPLSSIPFRSFPLTFSFLHSHSPSPSLSSSFSNFCVVVFPKANGYTGELFLPLFLPFPAVYSFPSALILIPASPYSPRIWSSKRLFLFSSLSPFRSSCSLSFLHSPSPVTPVYYIKHPFRFPMNA